MNRQEDNCEVCRGRPAAFVMLRRKRGVLYRTYVCQECAQERLRLHSGGSIDLQRMAAGNRSAQDAGFTCGVCGTTLADIVTDLRPGCCACYLRFSTQVLIEIERAQGRTYHVGKAPSE